MIKNGFNAHKPDHVEKKISKNRTTKIGYFSFHIGYGTRVIVANRVILELLTFGYDLQKRRSESR